MVDEEYKFIFPFELIPAGSKILIYGAGLVGQRYLKQVLSTNYCQVVGLADRNATAFQNMIVPVYEPKQIRSLCFDFVVIATRNSIPVHAIRQLLLEEGVSEEKIVFVSERSCQEIWLGEEDKSELALIDNSNLFDVFAFSLSGGIGDMIIQKRFLMEIIRLAPNCMIDIFCVNNVPFMKLLYADYQKNIRNIILNKGVIYQKNKQKYALGISLDGSGYWSVDVFQKDCFSASTDQLCNKIYSLISFWQSEDMLTTLSYNAIYSRWIYKGKNCYTRFSFEGIFDIQDENVTIPLDEAQREVFEGYNLNNYVTINFGVGNSIDGKGVAKAWPKEYFEELIHIIHKEFPNIMIVQVGGEKVTHLIGVDEYLLGKSFGLVEFVLKESLLHIDIEGGLMHLATQLGTKCAVLYGPTQVKYVGYSQNINILAGRCHDCYGLYDNLDRCARGMDKPECMYSITPEFVMEKIRKYLVMRISG